MLQTSMVVDRESSSRDLIRQMRRGMHAGEEEFMPESVAWQTFLELRRRGDPGARDLFIRALRQLHSRRALGAASLPNIDGMPDEHRLVEDSFLADLWKAYKKCISHNRTGPASQLLRDIEERIATH